MLFRALAGCALGLGLAASAAAAELKLGYSLAPTSHYGVGATAMAEELAKRTNGKWTTMGIPSDGSYGIPEGIVFGFPVTTENGEYKIVQGLEIDEFSQERINLTLEELQEEREGVKHLLP